MSGNPLGVVQTKRRTWDVEEYEQKAKDRSSSSSQPARAPPVMRDAAQSREDALNLESKIGRVSVVQTSGSRSEVGAFYCQLCDVTLRDNIAYLDHINGRKHQRMEGFSVRVEQVTVEDVRAKLASLKRKRDEISSYDLDARVKQLQEEEAEAKRMKREAKKLAKKNGGANAAANSGEEAHSDAEGPVHKKPKTEDAVEVVAEEVDPAFAAMGLPTSFGGPKK